MFTLKMARKSLETGRNPKTDLLRTMNPTLLDAVELMPLHHRVSIEVPRLVVVLVKTLAENTVIATAASTVCHLSSATH
jgi:hypothetical protein